MSLRRFDEIARLGFSTSTVQLSIEFTVPDLTGPQGESADVSLIYGLAIIALLIAIAAIVKKPR